MDNCSVRKKCKTKLNRLKYEMLIIKELTPSPKVQLASIGAKLSH